MYRGDHSHAMSYLPDHLSPTGHTTNGFADVAQTRAREALHHGQEFARENPVPVALGALAIGVVVGLLLHRTPKPRTARDLAREAVDDALGRARDNLSRIDWGGLFRSLRRSVGARASGWSK